MTISTNESILMLEKLISKENNETNLCLDKLNELDKSIKELDLERDNFFNQQTDSTKVDEKENKMIKKLNEFVKTTFNDELDIKTDKLNLDVNTGVLSLDNLKIDVMNKRYSVSVIENNELQNEYEFLIEILEEFGYSN